MKRKKIMNAEKAAYEIVCRLIDAGYVESEPEGMEWEHEISEIIEKNFGIKK